MLHHTTQHISSYCTQLLFHSIIIESSQISINSLSFLSDCMDYRIPHHIFILRAQARDGSVCRVVFCKFWLNLAKIVTCMLHVNFELRESGPPRHQYRECIFNVRSSHSRLLNRRLTKVKTFASDTSAGSGSTGTQF